MPSKTAYTPALISIMASWIAFTAVCTSSVFAIAPLSVPEFLKGEQQPSWNTETIQKVQSELQTIFTADNFYDMDYSGNCWCSTRPPFFYNSSIIMIHDDAHSTYTYQQQVQDFSPSKNSWQTSIPEPKPTSDNPHPYLLSYKYYGPMIVVETVFSDTVPVCNEMCDTDVDYGILYDKNDPSKCHNCTSEGFFTSSINKKLIDANECPPCGGPCNLRTNYTAICTEVTDCRYCTLGFMNNCSGTVGFSEFTVNCIQPSCAILMDSEFGKFCTTNHSQPLLSPISTNSNVKWARINNTFSLSCYDIMFTKGAYKDVERPTFALWSWGNDASSQDRFNPKRSDMLKFINTQMNTKYTNISDGSDTLADLESLYTPNQYFMNVVSRRINGSGTMSETIGCALDNTSFYKSNELGAADYEYYKLCSLSYDIEACLNSGGCPVYETFNDADCTCSTVNLWCHESDNADETSNIYDQLVATPKNPIVLKHEIVKRNPLLRESLGAESFTNAETPFFYTEYAPGTNSTDILVVYNKCKLDPNGAHTVNNVHVSCPLNATLPLLADGQCHQFGKYNSENLPNLTFPYNNYTGYDISCPPNVEKLKAIPISPTLVINVCVKTTPDPSRLCYSNYGENVPAGFPNEGNGNIHPDNVCPFEYPLCVNVTQDSQTAIIVQGNCTAQCNSSDMCPYNRLCVGLLVESQDGEMFSNRHPKIQLKGGYCSPYEGPQYYSVIANETMSTISYFQDATCTHPVQNCKPTMKLSTETLYTSTLQQFGCARSNPVKVIPQYQPNLHPITEAECGAMSDSADELNCVYEEPKCDGFEISTNRIGQSDITLPDETSMFGTYKVGPSVSTSFMGINSAVINKLLWMEFYEIPLKWSNTYDAYPIYFDFWQFHINWTSTAQTKNALTKQCGFPFCGTCMVQFTPESNDPVYQLDYASITYASDGTSIPQNDTTTLAPLMFAAVRTKYGYCSNPLTYPTATDTSNKLSSVIYATAGNMCMDMDCRKPWADFAGGLPGCTDVKGIVAAKKTPGCYYCSPGVEQWPSAPFTAPPVTSMPTTSAGSHHIGISGKRSREGVGVIFAFCGVALYVSAIYMVVTYYGRKQGRYSQLRETETTYE